MMRSEWLQRSTKQLESAGIVSARLDAELLLAHVLKVSRTKLLTNTDSELQPEEINAADALIDRRTKREPLAYIRGFVDFYGLELKVNSNVLIPRPETESLVEYAIKYITQDATVVDCGTGSGAIAVSLNHIRPDLSVTASDISPDALEVARANANKLKCDISFVESDLLTDVGTNFDWLITNLPYVRESQIVSPETAYEPSDALYSPDGGLQHYKRLFDQLKLRPTCHHLILEAEPDQKEGLIRLARDWRLLLHQGFCYVFERG